MTRNPTPGKVLAAISGGVDSAVAVSMLLRQGHDVEACFMRLRAGEDVQLAEHDASQVADHLGVRFHVVDFASKLDRVIRDFTCEYAGGRTPNPCARCNVWLKFGALLDHALATGADYLATGHHARVRQEPEPMVLRGVDPAKDQSYVLLGVPQDRFARVILPIGELTKRQVREMAEGLSLPVSHKADSQDICFVPDGDYVSRLASWSADCQPRPGTILDETGCVIGQHDGHQRFTIGQRRGLGVAVGRPVYVIAKDAAANTVTLGSRERLLASGLIAGSSNWLFRDVPGVGESWRCQVQIRYNSPAAAATVRRLDIERFVVHFDEPVFAVAPGQVAACYDGERLLGGGWIESALSPDESAH